MATTTTKTAPAGMTERAKEWQQVGRGLAFLSPWLLGFCLLTLLPVGLSFYYSLCDYPPLKKPVFVGLDNYRQLLWEQDVTGSRGDPIFWKSVYVTFKYAVLALPGGLFVSLGLAMLLNVRVPGQAVYRTIIFIPTLVPTIASAMLWMWLFNAKLGLINTLLARIGLEGPGWLTSPTWLVPALAIMTIWGVGNTVIIYLAGLQDVPKELYEAAEIDGAGVWRRLWHVTLPMLTPVIFFNLIMGIIGTLQVFDAPMIMTNGNGGTDRAGYFYTLYLYDNAFRYEKMGYASAMAWILLLIILALTGLAFWSSKKWVHYQGK